MGHTMNDAHDFSDAEVTAVRQKIERRWPGRVVEIHLADVDLSLDQGAQPREYPAIFWNVDGCNFLVLKTGRSEYRAEFFYSDMERFGTGIDTFSSLGECALTLLQIQADHESVRLGNFPGTEYRQ